MRIPLNFKLQTAEMYDGNTDPTVCLMTYIQHMELLSVSEEVIDQCFPLYLMDLAVMWLKQLENESIGTWTELVNRFMR